MAMLKSLLSAAFLIVGTPSLAKSTEPIGYISALPKGKWAFARLLWEKPAACTAEACEAGFHAPPLLISVRRYQDGFRVRTDVAGCPAMPEAAVWGPEYAALNTKARIARAALEVRRMSDLVTAHCRVPLPQNIPYSGLAPLFATPR